MHHPIDPAAMALLLSLTLAAVVWFLRNGGKSR